MSVYVLVTAAGKRLAGPADTAAALAPALAAALASGAAGAHVVGPVAPPPAGAVARWNGSAFVVPAATLAPDQVAQADAVLALVAARLRALGKLTAAEVAAFTAPITPA